MSFVAVDLGASGSRYTSNSGQISVVPNNMVFLPSMTVSNLVADAEDVESCLEVVIEKEGGQATTVTSEHVATVNSYFPAHVLLGIMAEKHHGANERPNMLMHKHKQKINYISAVLTCALSKLKNPEMSDSIDLYIAVPPVEIDLARKAFEEGLVGSYSVNFLRYMGGTGVKFRIASVQCHEEALMASTSFFFNMNGTPKENARKYITGNLLSIDIGASTSDLAVIKNGRYMDKSGQTFKTGGNEALDSLINEVRSRYAIDLPIGDAERAMVEGRLQMGNRYDDISDIVATTKSELAKKIITNMPGYFKRIDIPIQTINVIMVSGGGSMQSQYVNEDGEVVKTSEPMSFFVTNEMKEWCPSVDVVEYGEDARFANIKGLFIRAKMDARKKADQAPVQPQVQQSVPVQVAVASQPVATAPVAPSTTAASEAVAVAPSAPVASQSVAMAPNA